MELGSGLYGFGLPFLVILTVLVFVHEMGHYLVARRCGVRVQIFSIGFGPELFGWTDKGGTRWKFSVIPLGGYVKMFGDANAASMPDGRPLELTEAERAVAFPCKRLGQRAWIVAAGPLANFLFAVVLLAGLNVAEGEPRVQPLVNGVIAGSAAENAGFMPGDRIVEIDGQAITQFGDIQEIVTTPPIRQLSVTIERDGRELQLSATPRSVTETDAAGVPYERVLLGIEAPPVEYIHYGPAEGLWRAVAMTADLTGRTLAAVGEMIVGQRSVKELGGPIKIAEMSGQVAEVGVASAIWFMALLSINLGLINLFPVPMLDGGHLLFYAIEALRGRPLGERAQEFGFRIGLALVLSLIVLVTWNDIVGIYGRL